MATISLRGVHKRYGAVEVLRGIDLDVRQGEFVVLVGPSGCGKSTLLRLVAGLDELTSGEIRIDGERVDDLSPKDRDVAMVFQSYALYPHMTVRDNMSYALRRRGVARGDIDIAVRAASAKLGLDVLLDRKPKDLSGGQRQRVAMGRALVRNPKVFLFDEPLSNLDARLREQMRYEIRRLQRELGTTTLYVTHDQIEAMTMADRIVAMNEGKVQQIGSPSDLYDQPANRFVAEFIGSPGMNFLAADLTAGSDGAEVRVGGQLLGVVPLTGGMRDDPRSGPIVVGIRPERIGLTAPASGIGATVDWVEPTGLGAVVHADLAGQSVRLFTTDRASPAPGTRLSLAVRSEDLLLFDPATGRRL